MNNKKQKNQTAKQKIRNDFVTTLGNTSHICEKVFYIKWYPVIHIKIQ